MKKTDDAALAWLHNLLRLCRDGAAGYATAAADTADAELARMFVQYGHDRAKAVADLEHRIRDLRGDPTTHPTLGGIAHRAWMDYRASAGKNSAKALLTEVERCEDAAVDAFRRALRDPDLDAATRQLIQRHYESVQAAHDRVKQLRDRAGH